MIGAMCCGKTRNLLPRTVALGDVFCAGDIRLDQAADQSFVEAVVRKLGPYRQ